MTSNIQPHLITAFTTPFSYTPLSSSTFHLTTTPRRPRSFIYHQRASQFCRISHKLPFSFQSKQFIHAINKLSATQHPPTPSDRSYCSCHPSVDNRPILSADHTSWNQPHIPNSSFSSQQKPSKWTRFRIPFLIVLAAVPFTLLSILPSVPSPTAFVTTVTNRILHMGTTQASFALSVLNFFTVLLCFPANMGLMIGAGALLGPVPAFTSLFISKLVAACAAFSLARLFFFQRAQTWLSRHPRMSRILLDSGRTGGWKFVLLMRLSPFPGFMLNYLLSVTGVSFLEYTIGTLLGIAPSVLNLVLIGSTAKDVSLGVATGSATGGWLSLAMKTVCALSMIAVTVFVTKKTRDAFDDVDLNAEDEKGKILGEDTVESKLQI